MGSHASRADETRQVLDAVRRIVHTLRESSRWAERHVGLTGAQLFVLQTLIESPADSVNALAARTHTHQSSVSTVVTRLVAQGLVQRTRRENDRRQVQLSLTAKGRRLAERAPDVPQERLISAVQGLPATRRRLLASTLGELAAAMDVVERTPAMFFEDRSAAAKRGARRAR